MVILRVEDLTVCYRTIRGGVRALENVIFTLWRGEIMEVAGESGCGKSTLAQSLVAFRPPMRLVSGRVVLDGVVLPIDDREAMSAFCMTKIALIPQYAMNALNPTRKIGTLIWDILRSKRVEHQVTPEEVQRRLDFVRLSPEVLHMYPFGLSGGMRQRLVMVLATLLNPLLLMADEITSALDVAMQKAVAEMLLGFRDHGLVGSIIVITYDISILYQVADSILVMYAGQLAERAPTEVIIRLPCHPYTRMLISTLPEIGVRYTERRLSSIPGAPPLLLNSPPGCRFRERCPVAFKRCIDVPPFVEVEGNHWVACWREYGVAASL